MKNQADHTQRDKRVDLEKRISQLEEENQLLQGIINGTTNTVTVAEPVRDKEGKIIDFRYILFNNAVKRYKGASHSGASDDSYIGKTMLELFPGIIPNGNFKRYVDVVENNRQYADIEYHYPHEGLNHWFRESCYGYKDCVVVMGEDITDRKKKEEELAITSAILTELQEAFMLGSYEINTVDATIRPSANMLKIVKVAPTQEIYPVDFFIEHIYPEDRVWVAEKFAECIQKDIPYNMEHRLNLPNNELKWIISVGKLALDSAGNKTRLVGFVMDITERKESENQQTLTDTLLKEAFNVAGLGGWQWSEDFSQGFYTPQMREICGIGMDIPITLDLIRRTTYHEDLARIELLLQSFTKGKEPIDIKYRIYRLDNNKVVHIWAKGEYISGKLTGVGQDITEQVEREDKLKQSEALLLQSQEIAQLGGWQWNEDFSDVSFTPEMIKMFGFTENTKITLQQGLEIVYPDDVPNLSNLLQKVIETKGNYDAQYRIIRANDKAIRTIWAKGKFINGRLTGVAMDITERKLREAQLATSKALIAELQEMFSIGTYDMDTTSSILYASANLLKMYNIEPNQDVYTLQQFMDAIHPEDRTLTDEKVTLCIQKDILYNIEHRINLPNNELRWVMTIGKLALDSAGNKTRVVGFAMDITERKNSEEELLRSNTLLLESEKIGNIGAFRWFEDMSGGVGSPQFFHILGIENYTTYISMENYLSFIHPDDVADLQAYILEWKKTKGLYQTEYRIIRKDGQIRSVWIRASLVNGQLMGVLMDITERKEMELKNKKLALRNDELDAFVYTASHDLRSPVNNMEMLLEFLAKQLRGTQENATAGMYINLLNKSITDLKNTLEDLTTVTEIHPGEKKELVNLQTIVEQVQVSLYKQIQEAGASVQVELAVPFLTIPKKHVRSLVFNMLSNALKFRSQDRKPVVTISSYLKDDKIHLQFSDNGIGIKEADQPKVFMIFKRFNLEIAGRGVGMYLVKRVIDLNDGVIYLESKENVGTTFHIEFPLSQ